MKLLSMAITCLLLCSCLPEVKKIETLPEDKIEDTQLTNQFDFHEEEYTEYESLNDDINQQVDDEVNVTSEDVETQSNPTQRTINQGTSSINTFPTNDSPNEKTLTKPSGTSATDVTSENDSYIVVNNQYSYLSSLQNITDLKNTTITTTATTKPNTNNFTVAEEIIEIPDDIQNVGPYPITNDSIPNALQAMGIDSFEYINNTRNKSATIIMKANQYKMNFQSFEIRLCNNVCSESIGAFILDGRIFSYEPIMINIPIEIRSENDGVGNLTYTIRLSYGNLGNDFQSFQFNGNDQWYDQDGVYVDENTIPNNEESSEAPNQLQFEDVLNELGFHDYTIQKNSRTHQLTVNLYAKQSNLNFESFEISLCYIGCRDSIGIIERVSRDNLRFTSNDDLISGNILKSSDSMGNLTYTLIIDTSEIDENSNLNGLTSQSDFRTLAIFYDNQWWRSDTVYGVPLF